MVGVTADLVSTQMGNPRPQLFMSLAQHPASTVLVIARGAPSDPAMRGAFEHAIADGLRTISKPPDPDVVFRDLITGEWLIENSRSDLLTSSAVGGAAAGVALMLAALGVYGVIAFMVATRTREIGIRIALGASRSRVVRDVLGDSLRLVVPGIGVGLVLAALWVRLARSGVVSARRCRAARLLARRGHGVRRCCARRRSLRATRRGGTANRGHQVRVGRLTGRAAFL